MKSLRKILSLALALLLLSTPLMSTANALDTPFIPVQPDEDEGIFISPFYYTFDTASKEATVVDYGGWSSEAVIPESVEYEGSSYQVTTIGPLAFTADNTVYSITVPLSVVTVSAGAFNGCTSLSDVWYEGTETDKSGIAVGNENASLTSAVWHYGSCIHNPASEKVHVFDNACDPQCNYCDLTRTVPPHVFDNDKDITCNECGYMKLVPGDVDENASVTEDDALYLLCYVFFPEYYQINSHHDPDYDKDEDVDLDDVFYLLYHVYFPERFPIEIVL
ncbi:MAG: hypothetical protein E7580_04545 [Ruminococcaceae bacterium]|nr:hypothetical protein [Oscillospiraceae bacterium]